MILSHIHSHFLNNNNSITSIGSCPQGAVITQVPLLGKSRLFALHVTRLATQTRHVCASISESYCAREKMREDLKPAVKILQTTTQSCSFLQIVVKIGL